MSTAPTPRNGELKVTEVRHVRAEGQAVYDAIQQICGEKKTGALTIHFSEGHPCAAEWYEKDAARKTLTAE